KQAVPLTASALRASGRRRKSRSTTLYVGPNHLLLRRRQHGLCGQHRVQVMIYKLRRVFGNLIAFAHHGSPVWLVGSKKFPQIDRIDGDVGSRFDRECLRTDDDLSKAVGLLIGETEYSTNTRIVQRRQQLRNSLKRSAQSFTASSAALDHPILAGPVPIERLKPAPRDRTSEPGQQWRPQMSKGLLQK